MRGPLQDSKACCLGDSKACCHDSLADDVPLQVPVHNLDSSSSMAQQYGAADTKAEP